MVELEIVADMCRGQGCKNVLKIIVWVCQYSIQRLTLCGTPRAKTLSGELLQAASRRWAGGEEGFNIFWVQRFWSLAVLDFLECLRFDCRRSFPSI